jgi:hypothetical protein
MPTLRITYRLPSLIVLQRDPLPDLEFAVEDQHFRVKEPLWDDALSGALPWRRTQQLRRYRLADLLVIDALVPEAAVVRPYSVEGATVTEDGPAFDAVEPIVRNTVQRFLLLPQVETGQAWVGFLHKFSAWHSSPMQYELLDAPGGPMMPTTISEPDIEERWWLTAEKWQRIGEQLATGEDPPLPRILLAEEFAFQIAGRPRSAVLSLAMACEVALKRFLIEVPGAREPLYRYVVEKDRHLSIFDYLDEVLEQATGKRARDHVRATIKRRRVDHRDLRRLFLARNKVAHEGRAYVPSKTNSAVDEDTLDSFRAVTEALITWLDELRFSEGSG